MPRQCAHWLAMTISLQTILPMDCCFLHCQVVGGAQHPLNASCRARCPHRAGRAEKCRLLLHRPVGGQEQLLEFLQGEHVRHAVSHGAKPHGSPFIFISSGRSESAPAEILRACGPANLRRLPRRPICDGAPIAGFYFTVQLAGRNSSLNFSRANTSVMPAM